jgi:methylthioribose-1-phosphate isomerase
MRSEDTEHRSIWLEGDGWSVGTIDQTRLPEAFEASRLATLEETAAAIAEMQVRGGRGARPSGACPGTGLPPP